MPTVKSWKNLVLAPDVTHCYFIMDRDSVSKEINVEGGSTTGQFTIAKESTGELAELVYTTHLSLIGKNVS